jgi:hypothetical protein
MISHLAFSPSNRFIAVACLESEDPEKEEGILIVDVIKGNWRDLALGRRPYFLTDTVLIYERNSRTQSQDVLERNNCMVVGHNLLSGIVVTLSQGTNLSPSPCRTMYYASSSKYTLEGEIREMPLPFCGSTKIVAKIENPTKPSQEDSPFVFPFTPLLAAWSPDSRCLALASDRYVATFGGKVLDSGEMVATSEVYVYDLQKQRICALYRTKHNDRSVIPTIGFLSAVSWTEQ